MPASHYFTVTGGSYTDYYECQPSGQPSEYVSFQLLGSGNITFKQDLTTYFTVIGGGGGGGGSSSSGNGGGGGGAGAGGKISFITDHTVNYTYVVGTGGAGGSGSGNGVNGNDSSITFSGTESIVAGGGNFGSGDDGSPSGSGGGTGGGLIINNLNTIINGTSGAGGHGYIFPGVQPSERGTDQNPTSIEIYPDTVINVGGGGGGGSADGGWVGGGLGGGGGNGIGGARYGALVSTGVSGIAYGGGGGGAGYRAVDDSGGEGKEGAIFVYMLASNLPTNGCEWNPCLAAQTTIWNRFDGNCVDLSGATLNGQPMTRADLSEKRKATIFQYKNNSAGFSKKQLYSRLARGIGRQRGQSFATQSDTYTNPNTHNLVLDNSSVLLCPSGVTKNWAYTSQNDTPGPVIKITNYPTVPLTNYVVRRTYLAGSEKWPQYGPNTGQPRLPKYARNTGTKPGYS